MNHSGILVVGDIFFTHDTYILTLSTGADPGFQVTGGGVHLKKLGRPKGGAKIVGVFRVKNHDFTPKNNIFSNFQIRPTYIYTPAPQRGRGVYCFTSVLPSVQDIFRRIFLSNC
jgi:hypothetical protein